MLWPYKSKYQNSKGWANMVKRQKTEKPIFDQIQQKKISTSFSTSFISRNVGVGKKN